MNDRVLLGVLTPSSNTRLEPLTARMLADLPEVSAHFSRFRVVEVGLHAVGQFALDHILDAARLLADARVGAIVWSGTSGGWLGLNADRALCAAIEAETGIPATTSTLALVEAVGARTLGLVTPYPDDMHAAVVANLQAEGVGVVAHRNLAGTADNWALSCITTETLAGLVADVAAAGPAVISIFCTNLAAADQVEGWEARYGIPVFDSVALGLWRALDLAGVDPARVARWGALFHAVRPV